MCFHPQLMRTHMYQSLWDHMCGQHKSQVSYALYLHVSTGESRKKAFSDISICDFCMEKDRYGFLSASGKVMQWKQKEG